MENVSIGYFLTFLILCFYKLGYQLLLGRYLDLSTLPRASYIWKFGVFLYSMVTF